jgi:peroxiredoxin
VVLSVATLLSFRMFFVKWPITRDVPWANLLLLAASVAFLWQGTRRAFAPGRLRILRAITGSAVALLGVAVLAFFVMVVLIAPRAMPASHGAPDVGQKAPDFTLLDVDSKPVTLSELLSEPIPAEAGTAPGVSRAPKGVLLIFYMYSQCSACNSELHGMQQYVRSFADVGIRPVAISSDIPDVTGTLRQQAGYTFEFLSDQHADAIRRYDLLNADGSTARAAEFLIDTTGIVRWRNLTNDYYVRARPAQVLAAATMLP